MENLKIKPLNKEQLIISIDRLTRFKNTEDKYLRVFHDILYHNLILPQLNKNQIECMPAVELTKIAQYIINYSIENLGISTKTDKFINQKIYDYENSTFLLDDDTKELIDNEINYSGFIQLLVQNCPKNLQWLKALNLKNDIRILREKENFKFPIEKVLLVEGATEEILLPKFAKICNYDFDKKGVQIISAGGKNQVVKLYYELSQSLKLPIFVLLDKDGEQNALEINKKLRAHDKIHIIKCGEFEDLLSPKLLKETLSYEFKNISEFEQSILDTPSPKVPLLEEIFKTRGMHEFKKVEFAQMVKNRLITPDYVTPEISEIINEIKNIK